MADAGSDWLSLGLPGRSSSSSSSHSSMAAGAAYASNLHEEPPLNLSLSLASPLYYSGSSSSSVGGQAQRQMAHEERTRKGGTYNGLNIHGLSLSSSGGGQAQRQMAQEERTRKGGAYNGLNIHGLGLSIDGSGEQCAPGNKGHSKFMGVHKGKPGKYEASFWDRSCNEKVYLGRYEHEHEAARARDLAALKFIGPSTYTNFPLETYREEIEEMKCMTRQEFLAHMRKTSSISRGASKYRRVHNSNGSQEEQHNAINIWNIHDYVGVRIKSGKYQADVWDKSCKKLVYLGSYDNIHKAARARDLAVLKLFGLTRHTNFPIETYREELEEMKKMTWKEYVVHLKRTSSCFSRGASKYRGVSWQRASGKWLAQINVTGETGSEACRLGCFDTEEEAAAAYDVAVIKRDGGKAMTNFHITKYTVNKTSEGRQY